MEFHKSSTNMKDSPFDEQSQNCICIHIAFVELLLPVLRFYVNHKMKVFFLKLFPGQVHKSAEKVVQTKSKKKRSKKNRVKTGKYQPALVVLPKRVALADGRTRVYGAVVAHTALRYIKKTHDKKR